MSKNNSQDANYNLSTPLYDSTLFWVTMLLMLTGFIMVMSSSISLGAQINGDPFYFSKRDIIYIGFSLIIFSVGLSIPMSFWCHYSNILLLISILILVIVLFVGSSINGASRWITLGGVHIQPSEISKLLLFCYLASYISRKKYETTRKTWGGVKPTCITIVLSMLLLAQPDLGTVIIIFSTTLITLFLAGARLYQLLLIVVLATFIFLALIITEPYRVERITAFLSPWKDPFGGGYQLTQSLMAFGRGDFFGQGIGNSLHKLEYLPEAHTDFIFAIIGEEAGFIGSVTLLSLEFFYCFSRPIYRI
jgi:cell division protein FtsW